MAKKWLDSIEKQKKKKQYLWQTDRRAYIQTDTVNDKNNRLLAIRLGDQLKMHFCMWHYTSVCGVCKKKKLDCVWRAVAVSIVAISIRRAQSPSGRHSSQCQQLQTKNKLWCESTANPVPVLRIAASRGFSELTKHSPVFFDWLIDWKM